MSVYGHVTKIDLRAGSIPTTHLVSSPSPGARIILIDSGFALADLLSRRRGEFPPDIYEALVEALVPVPQPWYGVDVARGILRTASALWRFEAKRRGGDRDLWKAAKAAFDIATTKQVVTAGEDL